MILVNFITQFETMKSIYATVIACLFFIGTALGQGPWELVKDKDGIKIHNRKMEGTKLKEYKGVIQLDASVNDVLKILSNPSMHDQFIYKAKKGSVELLKKADKDMYTYMVIETPWPASNRDVVTHYHTSPPAKDGSVTIDVSTGSNTLKPHQKGIVRVEKMKGYWKIVPLSNGKVEVTHQAYSSPGGNVPDGMANSASVDAPYEMLIKLKALVK